MPSLHGKAFLDSSLGMHDVPFNDIELILSNSYRYVCGGVLIELPSNLDLLDDISFVKLGLLVEMIFDLPPTLYISFSGHASVWFGIFAQKVLN
ncbi:unnamed protein product [Camellia sinensis]